MSNNSSLVIATKLTKIGNSKGIIVPSLIIKSLGLDEGDNVNLHYDEKKEILYCTFPHSKQLKLA